MTERGWRGELWRLGGLTLGALVLGLAVGGVLPVLLAAAAGYAAYHLHQLRRLHRCLKGGGKAPVPVAGGLWGEVFNEIHRMQKRNRARKRKLANMLKRFNESAAAMPDATVVLDGEGRMEWVNKAACQWLGLHPKADLGQRVDNLVRAPQFVAYLAAGDFSRPLEMRSPVNPEQRLLVTVVPYGKRRRLLVVRDVTRLHRLEQMRRDFVANVSHELRTPLTVIGGYLENLHGEADVPPHWRSIVAQMRQQAQRMCNIVEDLLLLSRLETDEGGPPEDPVPVPALLAGLRDEALALSGEAGHRIHLEAEPGLWLAGSEKELHSAFGNLVFNAVKYTPPGGEITLRWGSCDGGGARLDVEDTGIGVTAQHIPRLTERFYRVDAGRSRAQGGTGLGLAIVKHVLIRHQGRLEIESEPGRGSRFTCLFPAARVLRQRPATAAGAPT